MVNSSTEEYGKISGILWEIMYYEQRSRMLDSQVKNKEDYKSC